MRSSRDGAARCSSRAPALGGRRQEAYVYLPSGYAQHPLRRYPVLYLLHGFPGRPLAFLDTVQMGVVDDTLTARGQRAAADPRDAVRLDRHVQRQGVGERRLAAATAGRRSSSRDLVRYDRRALPHDRRRGSGARSAACRRAATARSTSRSTTRASSRVVESWSGYQRPDRLRADLRLEAAAARRATIPSTLLPQVAPELRQARHVLLVLLGVERPASASRTPRSRTSSRPSAAPASLLQRVRRPQLGDLARQRARRLPRRGDEARPWLGVARRGRAPAALALGVLVAGATGWLYVAAAGRGAARAALCRRARARRALAARQRRRCSSTSPSGRRRRCCSALLARWAGADRLTAGLLLGLGRRRHGSTALNGVSILVVRQISAHDGLPRGGDAAGGRDPGRARRASLARCSADRGRRRAAERRFVLAWLVAGVGVLAVVDAVFPEHGRSLVAALDAVARARSLEGARRRRSRPRSS